MASVVASDSPPEQSFGRVLCDKCKRFVLENILLRYQDPVVEKEYQTVAATEARPSSVIWMFATTMSSFASLSSTNPERIGTKPTFLTMLPVHATLLLCLLASFRAPQSYRYWVWRIGGPLFLGALAVQEILILRSIDQTLTSLGKSGVCSALMSTYHGFISLHPVIGMLALRLLWTDFFILSIGYAIGFNLAFPSGTACLSIGSLWGTTTETWVFVYAVQRVSRASFATLLQAKRVAVAGREEATRSADALTRLVQGAGAPILGVSTTGLVTVWNDALAALTGSPPEEAVGRDLLQSYVQEHHHGRVRPVLRHAAAGKSIASFELPLQSVDGGESVLLLSADPQLDSSGACSGSVCVGQDVTSRVRMENARRLFLASFSHELRTPLNGLLGMLELLTHHSRSHSRSGRDGDGDGDGSRGRRKKLAVAFASAKHLQKLINDICDLSRIEAGRVDLESEPLRLPSLLRSTLRVLRPHAHSKGVSLRCECAPDVPPLLLGDAMRLSQIVTNLTWNGVKFTPADGRVAVRCDVQRRVAEPAIVAPYVVATPRDALPSPHLAQPSAAAAASPPLGQPAQQPGVATVGSGAGEAAAAAVFAPHGYVMVRLQVQDTGCGIAAQDMPKLFRMFSQIDSARHAGGCSSSNEKGSGLGLSISRRLAQLMQGDIAVQSVQGLGSSFECFVALLLPPPDLVKDDVAAAADPESGTEGSEGGEAKAAVDGTSLDETSLNGTPLDEAGGSSPLSILLVEDNEFNRDVAVAFFEDSPHVVRWVENGLLAVEAVTATAAPSCPPYDIVLMDCGMPVMDGYEATRRIRRWEEQSGAARLPIIGVTAFAMTGDKERCLAAGMDDYLTKPVSRAALLSTVYRWTGRAAAAAAAGSALSSMDSIPSTSPCVTCTDSNPAEPEHIVLTVQPAEKEEEEEEDDEEEAAAAEIAEAAAVPSDSPSPTKGGSQGWFDHALATADGTEPVNLRAALASFGGDSAVAATFLLRFVQHCERALSAIAAAMQAGDVATVGREGHSLKGAAGYVAAAALSAAAKCVQDAARAEGATVASPAVLEAVEGLNKCGAQVIVWVRRSASGSPQ